MILTWSPSADLQFHQLNRKFTVELSLFNFNFFYRMIIHNTITGAVVLIDTLLKVIIGSRLSLKRLQSSKHHKHDFE